MSSSESQVVWEQSRVNLKPKPRGCHVVTKELLTASVQSKIQSIRIGLAHFMLLHTSASLVFNECWDPDVRIDMETILNDLVPQGKPYVHSIEGPDDMPAHAKTALLGVQVSIPISKGKLEMGSWGGLWLCEHRDEGGSRQVVITLNGIT